ncbi:MAG: hypothetical protein ACFFC3_16875 [Candidatus Odinarchaeota archaeon]
MIILYSLIGGIFITLFTGILAYPKENLIGSEKWGLPFYWLSRPVYPGAEKIINWANLLIDFLIWIILMFMIFMIIYLIGYFFSKVKKKSEKND